MPIGLLDHKTSLVEVGMPSVLYSVIKRHAKVCPLRGKTRVAEGKEGRHSLVFRAHALLEGGKEDFECIGNHPNNDPLLLKLKTTVLVSMRRDTIYEYVERMTSFYILAKFSSES